ncbi:MAG TPA: chromosomal replication initiator protein DnaA [Saprospiraceae bacterium]|nr:chromosomal replication initiator protein DnaA [Saprospiraceae bacterium]
MIKDEAAIWGNCLEFIKKHVNAQSFKTWFDPIKPVKVNGSILTIQVPNKFFYEWLEENYVDILRTSLKKELGEKASLEYQILVDNHRKIGKAVDVEEKEEEIRNPFVIPGIKRVKTDSQLISKYTFENFIEGECNKLARSAGIEITSKPGNTPFNPLFIFGDTGLGKTHLSNAIGNALIKKFPTKQVLFVSTEQFTNQVINAIRANTINDFMHFYQTVDVLIVDDIQFLSNRPKTQEIFFNIFNQLHQNGKQIILTSDRAPKDLQDVEKRLISRFKWGLNTDLGAPAFETRLNIFKLKMKHEGILLPEELVDYICHHVKSNVRELEGVLISLVARSALNKTPINLNLVKEVVEQFVNTDSKEISVENIKKLVAEHFELPIEKLQGKTRKRQVVIARQLSMYLAKNFTNSSLKTIGLNFGGKDHSTVIYSIKAVQDLIDTDTIFRDTVNQLEKKVQLSLNA